VPPHHSVVPTSEFLESFTALSRDDQRRVLRALALLDESERQPSLRVHQLRGDLAGQWSASASASLRITFRRLGDGRKELVAASRERNNPSLLAEEQAVGVDRRDGSVAGGEVQVQLRDAVVQGGVVDEAVPRRPVDDQARLVQV
jgi:mRNA-degrading endonuclease YafQ of YafQ-DinJ toxin-antitoxin module